MSAALLDTIEQWVDDSDADELAKWNHTYLAHAVGPAERGIEAQFVATNKISETIQALARVTEGISACLLWSSGRSSSLMPVAHINPFEKLNNPIMEIGSQGAAHNLWHQLRNESDRYLDSVEAELIQRVKMTQ